MLGEHKRPGQFDGLPLVLESQCIQPGALGEPQRDALEDRPLFGMQQAIRRAKCGLVGQGGVAGFKGHEGGARFAVDLLASIHFQQLVVQAAPERGQQGLAFGAMQIVLGQVLVERTALGQEVLAVLLQMGVQAFQVGQFGGRCVAGQQRRLDVEQVLADQVE